MPKLVSKRENGIENTEGKLVMMEDESAGTIAQTTADTRGNQDVKDVQDFPLVKSMTSVPFTSVRTWISGPTTNTHP